MEDKQLKFKEQHILLILFFFSLIIRLLNINHVFYMNSFIPPDPDVAYHLRIIQLIFNSHIHVPLFDYYSNFPTGSLIYWPLGFDYFLACVSLPVFLIFGTMTSVEIFLSFFIPVLGAVNVVIIYLASKEFSSNKMSSLLAALLFSLFYFHYNYSNVGHIDHHIAESLIFSLCILFYIKIIKTGSDLFEKILGITLGISLCFWNGAFIYAGIIASGFFGILFLDDCKETVIRIWKHVFFYALISGTISVLLYNNYYRIVFSTLYLSFFHIALLLVLYFFPFIIESLKSLLHKTVKTRALFFVAIVGFFLFTAGLLWISNGTVLIDFLFKSDRNSLVVTESQDITQRYLTFLMQTLIIFIPILFYYTLRKIATKKNPLYISFFIFLVITTILGFSQIRFMIYLGIITSIIMSEFIYSMMTSFSNLRKSIKYLIILCYLMFMFLPPSYELYERKASLNRNSPDYYIKTLKPALMWLKNHTPATDYYLTPDKKPSYGVLYPLWSHGHYICYQGERPTIANAFGGGGSFDKGIEKCLEVVFSKKEIAVYNIMKKQQLRYLIFKDFKSFLPLFYKAYTLGNSLNEDVDNIDTFYSSLFLSRLNLVDKVKVMSISDKNSFPEQIKQFGIYMNLQPPFFEHFRLVFNSPYTDEKTKYPLSRIFEAVPGVTITGYGIPKHNYIAYMILKSDKEDPFYCAKTIFCDSNGFFSFTWPYNTDKNGDIKALTKLELIDPESTQPFASIQINENEVINGGNIVLE